MCLVKRAAQGKFLHADNSAESRQGGFAEFFIFYAILMGGLIMVRILSQADKEIVLEYLERNHMETTFLIGNVLEFGMDNDRDKRRCGDYYGFFEGDELRGVLPFYNLGSCIPHFEAEAAVEEFSKLMLNRDFEFLLGMEKIIKPLFERIKENKKVLDYSEDSYFINNNFKPFYSEGLEVKDAQEIDIDKAVEFNIYANKDGFGNENSRESTLKTLKQRADEEDFIFGISNGKIIAQACIQTFTNKVNQIGGVYTLGDERGKGYCKAIVSTLCERIVKRGKIPTLMVKKTNTPAVRAYNSVGFEYYDDYLIIKFEK